MIKCTYNLESKVIIQPHNNMGSKVLSFINTNLGVSLCTIQFSMHNNGSKCRLNYNFFSIIFQFGSKFFHIFIFLKNNYTPNANPQPTRGDINIVLSIHPNLIIFSDFLFFYRQVQLTGQLFFFIFFFLMQLYKLQICILIKGYL